MTTEAIAALPNTARTVSVPVSGWTILKWVMAICIAIVAVFPIWWMINVVFAEPGTPVSLNPRLYPTSLSAGISKILMIMHETDYLRAYYVSLAYSLLTISGVLIIGSMAAF